MNEERYIESLPVVPDENDVIIPSPHSSVCCCMNRTNASPTTAKDSAVLTSAFVMEVSSVMKGGMGLVGLTNS